MKKIIPTVTAARLLAPCLLLLGACTHLQAQTDSTTAPPLFNSPKVIIHLMDGSVVKGTVLYITDSSLTVEKPASPAKANQQPADSAALQTNNNIVIPTQAIKSIKLKRNAFIAGFAIGGLIGYGSGYVSGYAMHRDDATLSYDENHENAKTLAHGMAIAGAAGMGLIGGAIAPVFARKKFVINGSREAMQKFIKVLERTP